MTREQQASAAAQHETVQLGWSVFSACSLALGALMKYIPFDAGSDRTESLGSVGLAIVAASITGQIAYAKAPACFKYCNLLLGFNPEARADHEKTPAATQV